MCVAVACEIQGFCGRPHGRVVECVCVVVYVQLFRLRKPQSNMALSEPRSFYLLELFWEAPTFGDSFVFCAVRVEISLRWGKPVEVPPKKVGMLRLRPLCVLSRSSEMDKFFPEQLLRMELGGCGGPLASFGRVWLPNMHLTSQPGVRVLCRGK